jgi:hypothetical protein
VVAMVVVVVVVVDDDAAVGLVGLPARFRLGSRVHSGIAQARQCIRHTTHDTPLQPLSQSQYLATSDIAQCVVVYTALDLD